MVFPRSMRFVLSALLFLSTARAEDPAPFFQDEWSGKTIHDMDAAAAMVIHRFYNAPRYGSKAPGFALPELGTGKTVQLEDLHAERPVVLLFSSYGCNVFRDSIEKFLEVHEEFSDRFEFVMIYVREAHALDGLHPDLAKLKDPNSDLERKRAAEICRVELGLPFRILVDTLDDRVATRWAGWPLRLYVVDRRGTVVYAGKPGPWGFAPGRGVKPELADELRKHEDRFSQETLEEFLRTYLDT